MFDINSPPAKLISGILVGTSNEQKADHSHVFRSSHRSTARSRGLIPIFCSFGTCPIQMCGAFGVFETIKIEAVCPVGGLIMKFEESQYLFMNILWCRMEEGDP